MEGVQPKSLKHFRELGASIGQAHDAKRHLCLYSHNTSIFPKLSNPGTHTGNKLGSSQREHYFMNYIQAEKKIHFWIQTKLQNGATARTVCKHTHRKFTFK